MENLAIDVQELHKEFLLPQHRYTALKERFAHIGKKNIIKTQKVLDGISFQVNKGDFFGVVGRNGSGKSTLLKILAGVYAPTRGTVNINGELTPFIELGVGFNPELSGRDNVFLNGALLGFSRKEMSTMYDDIVEFAELEAFMDQKLKNYSSGMQVRLAFSIAIKAKNNILIFDEVLAVGDEAFQRKCFDVFEAYKSERQTVVLVTHDMETVRKFCNRAMLLSDGKIVKIGDPRSVADKYSQLNQSQIDKGVDNDNRKNIAKSNIKVKILNTRLEPQAGFKFGEKMIVKINWKDLPTTLESIGINIIKQSGEHLTGINSRTGNHKSNWKEIGEIGIEFKLNILPGKYNILVEAFEAEGRRVDSISKGLQFTVANHKMEWSGLVELPHSWIEDK